MKYDYNLYDLCEELLLDLLYLLETENNNFNQMMVQLQRFFCTNNSKYESVMETFDSEIGEDDRKAYKIIMMLIILSGSYKISFHEYQNGIDVDANKDIIDELESLDIEDAIKKFYSSEIDEVAEYIADYMKFGNASYLYKNECLKMIIEKGKLKELFRINPFEGLLLIDYIEPDKMLESEKVIQTVTNLFDKAEYAIACEVETNMECGEDYDDEIDYANLREKFHELLLLQYNNDKNKVLEVYRYILSNVYETLKFKQNSNFSTPEEEKIIKYIELNQDSWIKNIEKLFEDDNFFSQVISCFMGKNSSIEDGDLCYQRDEIIKKSGDKVLRKLNPYFKEEEIVFREYLKRD